MTERIIHERDAARAQAAAEAARAERLAVALEAAQHVLEAARRLACCHADDCDSAGCGCDENAVGRAFGLLRAAIAAFDKEPTP